MPHCSWRLSVPCFILFIEPIISVLSYRRHNSNSVNLFRKLTGKRRIRERDRIIASSMMTDAKFTVSNRWIVEPSDSLVSTCLTVLSSTPTSRSQEISTNYAAVSDGGSDTTEVKLSEYLMKASPEQFPSVSSIKKLLRRGLLSVNGVVADTTATVRIGDEIAKYMRNASSLTSSSPHSSSWAQRRSDHSKGGSETFSPPEGENEDIAITDGTETRQKRKKKASRTEFAGNGNDMKSNVGAYKVEVLWEDADLAVVVKPHGMPIFTAPKQPNTKVTQQPIASKNKRNSTEVDRFHEASDDDGSEKEGEGGSNSSSSSVPFGYNLYSALLHSLNGCGAYVHSEPASSVHNPLNRPMPAHRLDMDTGGLVVVAKSHPALITLTKMFAERRVYKQYQAIVAGSLEGSGTIDFPLSGKMAVTRYRSLCISSSISYGNVTTVEVIIETGRKHQIRRHLHMIGHPIVGDLRYWLRKYDHSCFAGEIRDSFTAPAEEQFDTETKRSSTASDLDSNVEVIAFSLSMSPLTPDARGSTPIYMAQKDNDQQVPLIQEEMMYLCSIRARFQHPVRQECSLDLAIPEPQSFQDFRALSEKVRILRRKRED